MINIVPWPELPGIGTLESFEPEYLDKVNKEIQKYGFFAEIDTNGTDPKHLTEVIEAAHRIGADVIRTYTCMGEYDPDRLRRAPEDIKQIVPLLKKYRIKLAVENHEEELTDEVIQIIKEVNSPWVGAHCDFGNAMMAWEDPVEAVRKLAMPLQLILRIILSSMMAKITGYVAYLLGLVISIWKNLLKY
ncbi:sugar phosphate isomerase/epimerase [Peribacillus frigoritolerans]|uniref:sugar phosphate isomerase/epimerase family protein n=1 Tax=Peribacillus frigoritolerans TaxID=450367 RepID=UPI0024BF1E27|nr:sugar phosphate isomerase/epimerase [Peribacillus frigoritolerans]WHY15883.1 sugar phosphate isomerase/epimerase [Peribacillus frigoritolerans]